MHMSSILEARNLHASEKKIESLEVRMLAS